MEPKLEETIVVDFATSHPTTGAAADADSAPSVEVYEDATDTPILTLTATKRTSKTGIYRVAIACTAANGFEAGKSYNAHAIATVAGVQGKAIVTSFVLRARSIDDQVIVSPAGLDQIMVEAGLNMRQAMSLTVAAAAGALAGALTPTVAIAAAGVPATNRITATVDTAGNRSAVILNPPA